MRFLAAVCALAMAAVWAGPADAEDDPPFLAIYGGASDIFDDHTAAMFGVEYRTDFKDLILTPMVGGFVNTDGSAYGYGGVFVDFFFGKRVVLRPSFSVGAYEDGDGKDLGGVLEFRSAVALDWRFDDRSRLGIEFSHISNASIYDSNPGMEILTVNYSIPLDALY